MKDLLLLHGALGSSSQFDSFKNKLKNNFHVHTLDFSGHGGLPIPEEKFSMEIFMSDILSFLKLKNLDQINIFGNSMGGYVGLSLASLYPDKVKKLFTFATLLEWSPQRAEQEVKMLDPDKIVLKIPAFAEMLKQKHSPADWKEIMIKTSEMMTELGNHHLHEIDFRKIECPVRISVGDSEHIVSVAPCLTVSTYITYG